MMNHSLHRLTKMKRSSVVKSSLGVACSRKIHGIYTYKIKCWLYMVRTGLSSMLYIGEEGGEEMQCTEF